MTPILVMLGAAALLGAALPLRNTKIGRRLLSNPPENEHWHVEDDDAPRPQH